MPKAPHHKVRALAEIAERMIGDLGENAAARKLQAEVNRLHAGAAALDGVRLNRSPLDTTAAHALNLGKLARQFSKETTVGLNRSIEVFREANRDIDRRIGEKVDLRPDAFAEEIRSAFRGLSRAEKLKELGRLVKENRGPELAAIVRAPGILSGLTDEDRANYERSIVGMHAAEEVAERKALEEVFDAVHSAQQVASGIVEEFSDPLRLAEIERGDEAARAANDAFAQSIDPSAGS